MMSIDADVARLDKVSNRLCVATIAALPGGQVVPVRCKSWSCPVCAPINAFREAVKVAHGIAVLQAEGRALGFATLTEPPAVATSAFAYSILPSQWDKLRNRLQYVARKQGDRFSYAAFVEGQSKRGGMPHFHIVASALPPKRLLREFATASGFGPQADVQALRAGTGVAWYVAKYSSKPSPALGMPKGFRRVRYSQDWPKVAWRLDGAATGAVVRMPAESMLHWSHRAARAYGGNQEDWLFAAVSLLDASLQRDGTLDADAVSALLRFYS